MQTLRYCVECTRAYRRIHTHYRTSKSYASISPPEHECTLCYEACPLTAFVQCVRCIYYWCTTCQTRLRHCPYCRLGAPPTPVQTGPPIHLTFFELQERLQRFLHRMLEPAPDQ
jgi:hypothetical protein